MALRLSYDGSRHVRALEGFRGYAVSGVFLYHCLLYPPLRPLVVSGWSGVDLFFVISGFLITGILLDTRTRPHCLRDFYVRRVLRIFPIYYATLAVLTVALWLSDDPASERSLARMPWFWAYLQNLLIAFRGWSGVFTFGHFWSLAIEEQFYLVWPLLVCRLRMRTLLVISSVAALGSFTLRQIHPGFPFAYTFTLCRLEGLMIGGAIAMLVRTDRARLERWLPYILPVSGLGLGALAWLQGGLVLEDPWVIRLGYGLLAVFFGSLLVCALDQGWVGRVTRTFTDWSVPVFVGRYSYGIYVYHWILHCQLKRPLLELLEQHLGAPFAVFTSYFAIMAALTLGLSIASFHLFEARFLRLKRVLAPRPGEA
jgi:peptidoglycan/LPS O-acetylase OafA/YrhL